MTIATINPATGRTERTFQPLSDAELDVRIQCAADNQDADQGRRDSGS
jgi:hypothetical protein